jgi:hypothetical protein
MTDSETTKELKETIIYEIELEDETSTIKFVNRNGKFYFDIFRPDDSGLYSINKIMEVKLNSKNGVQCSYLPFDEISDKLYITLTLVTPGDMLVYPGRANRAATFLRQCMIYLNENN